MTDQNFSTQTGLYAAYTGERMRLFWLALRSIVFTILTIGIYRFWMITKLRKHFLGSIQISGDPLEYTGRPLEKLLGFLIAMVILAIYLGLVNLLLTFVGFSLASDDPVQTIAALYITIFAALPLLFYAQYRSARYILSRIRWRGIRFGMEPGAWSFTWRAILLTLLTIVTLGLAAPYMQFVLAKFMTNRARFGDMSFGQEGRWTMLFGPYLLIYAFVAVFSVGSVVQNNSGPDDTLALVLVLVGLLGLYFALFRYQFIAFKKIWSHKTLGEASFESHLNVGQAIGMLVTGFLISIGALILIGGIGAAIIAGLLYTSGFFETLNELSGYSDGEAGEQFIAALFQHSIVLIGGLVIYLVVIAVLFAIGQVFLTQRLLKLQVEAMEIRNAQSLALGRQRAHDDSAEAGGFADALGVDVGAGF